MFILCYCLQLNENLVKNEEIWKAKMLEIEERYAFILSILLIGDVFIYKMYSCPIKPNVDSCCL